MHSRESHFCIASSCIREVSTTRLELALGLVMLKPKYIWTLSVALLPHCRGLALVYVGLVSREILTDDTIPIRLDRSRLLLHPSGVAIVNSVILKCTATFAAKLGQAHVLQYFNIPDYYFECPSLQILVRLLHSSLLFMRRGGWGAVFAIINFWQTYLSCKQNINLVCC